MKIVEKILSFIYNSLGWIAWTSVIGLVVFMVYLFSTGETRLPQISVDNVNVVSDLSADGEFAKIRSNPEGFYRVDMKVTIKGNSLSPYTFSAKGIRITDNGGLNIIKPADLKDGDVIISDGEVKYSKLSQAEFTTSFYVYSKNGGERLISDYVKNMKFRLTNMTLHFSLLNLPVSSGTPEFSVN